MTYTTSNKKSNRLESLVVSCLSLVSVKPHGFTLIEVLVAALVVTLGAGAAFALTQSVAGFSANVALQLEASYLAQEGMEIVRNIRDANFLKIHKGQEGTWTDGLTGCSAGCEADWQQSSLSVSSGRLLKLNSGLYNYSAGEETLFQRTITVAEPQTDVLAVEVKVSWQERGRSHEVEAAGELYNWLVPAEEP